METMGKRLLSVLVMLLVALAFVGCGGDEPESGNGTVGVDGGNGDGGATNATCTDACTKLLELCPPEGLTQAMCESHCSSEFNQATRNCVAGASTCADANQCEADSGGSGDGGNEGAIGESCIDGAECNSGLCKVSAGAFEGQCVQNDLGEQCQSDSECVHARCMYRGDDVFGFCSITCTDDSSCPFGWSCVNVGNSTADVCDID